VYNVLFGNVLGISGNDVSRILWSSLTVVVIFTIVGRPLFFASIDPDVAAARGVPVRTLAFCFLVLLALVVSVAVQVIGVLLIFSLLVTPAAIAQQLFTRPVLAITASILLSVSFIWLGLAVGYFSLYPVGFFVTTIAFGTYALVRGARFILRPGLVHNDEIPVAVVEGDSM
jgi:zinc/manganese transport system permease protein